MAEFRRKTIYRMSDVMRETMKNSTLHNDENGQVLMISIMMLPNPSNPVEAHSYPPNFQPYGPEPTLRPLVFPICIILHKLKLQ